MSHAKTKRLTVAAAVPLAVALLAKLPSATDVAKGLGATAAAFQSGAAPVNHPAWQSPAIQSPQPAVPVAGSDAPPLPAIPAPTPDCLARFTAVGLPSEGDMAGRAIVCRRGYVLAYDPLTRDPDWVMEHLAPSDVGGDAERSNAFRHDPNLPQGMDAGNKDYAAADGTGAHYDRGHQAPAGDAAFSQTIQNESFYFSNMAPQVGNGFNRGVWRDLETTVRGWVKCGGHSDLYVITGPIYPAGPAPRTIGTDKVVVPDAFYKIVYDASSQRAVGFVLQNKVIGSKIPDLQVYVKPIADIETATGLSFFPALDARLRTQIKAQAAPAWGHVANCKLGKGS